MDPVDPGASGPRLRGKTLETLKILRSQKPPLVAPAMKVAVDDRGAEDFPSTLECPLTLVPPVHAVTFDVRNNGGKPSPRVFEYAALFRWIATQGDTAHSKKHVKHPLNGAWIARDRALGFVRNVPPEVQERIHAERVRRELPLDPEGPSVTDNIAYYDTVRWVKSRRAEEHQMALRKCMAKLQADLAQMVRARQKRTVLPLGLLADFERRLRKVLEVLPRMIMHQETMDRHRASLRRMWEALREEHGHRRRLQEQEDRWGKRARNGGTFKRACSRATYES